MTIFFLIVPSGFQNLDYHVTDYKITMHKMFKLVKKKKKRANTKPTKNDQVDLEKSQVASRTSKNVKKYKFPLMLKYHNGYYYSCYRWANVSDINLFEIIHPVSVRARIRI